MSHLVHVLNNAPRGARIVLDIADDEPSLFAMTPGAEALLYDLIARQDGELTYAYPTRVAEARETVEEVLTYLRDNEYSEDKIDAVKSLRSTLALAKPAAVPQQLSAEIRALSEALTEALAVIPQGPSYNSPDGLPSNDAALEATAERVWEALEAARGTAHTDLAAALLHTPPIEWGTE